MSGLIESIVRRRRASASTRLGPPSENGYHGPGAPTPANGAAPAEVEHVNGSSAPVAEQVVWPTRGPTAAPEEAEVTQEFGAVAEPVAPEPAPAQEQQTTPTFRERGHVRRRARYLERLREIQLRDLGGFMVELHRFGRERPDLIAVKLEGAVKTDSELRALHRSLGADAPLREIREAGIGGACHACGAVHGSEDRYCSSCGEPLRE